LGSHEVETLAAATAAECLLLLKNQTFDCMVLDLSLPDASGYSLLETLSQEGAYSFPPVIVYTGRDLSGEEEQRLRRYSKSIIIKGAKSPERLLDEVSLFLHQVISDLPDEQQRMIRQARNRDALLEGRRILVVEDDVRNVYSLTSILEPRGARVQIARNGREAIEAIDKSFKDGNAIDLVLMDVMMPVMDGLMATEKIRQNPDWRNLPIIMLTAKASESERVAGLDLGADDYITKPFSVRELLARVRAVMRRADETMGKTYEDDHLIIDFDDIRVVCDGAKIKLTNKEFTLLSVLARSADRVVTRQQLLDSVWGYSYYGDARTLDVHIRRLRQKLDKCGDCIETVVGVGYRFVGCSGQTASAQ